MSNNTFEDKTLVTKELFSALKTLDSGISISIKRDSICLGRYVRDKASFQNLKMLSAIASLNTKEVCYYLYIGEQHDAGGKVKKYWIKLTDDAKVTLKEYHLDHKGAHIHEYNSGRKNSDHRSSNEDILEIAKDVLSQTQ